jgi:reverse gyrase
MPALDRYLVLRCPNCRGIITADGCNKTRTCPLCARKIELRKVRVIFSHASPLAAALAAQKAMERSTRNADPERGFEFRSEGAPR